MTFFQPSRDTHSTRKTGIANMQHKYMLELGKQSGNTRKRQVTSQGHQERALEGDFVRSEFRLKKMNRK